MQECLFGAQTEIRVEFAIDCRAAILAANEKETAAKITALQVAVLVECGRCWPST